LLGEYRKSIFGIMYLYILEMCISIFMETLQK
jgi:hypothetical protein